MRFRIHRVTYSGFIKDWSKLKHKPTDDWLRWFETRSKYLILNPLDMIFKNDAEYHFVIDDNTKHFYLPLLGIVCSHIDFLGYLLLGLPGRRRHPDIKDRYSGWIKQYMKDWDISDPHDANNKLIDWLYYGLRNGLTHQFRIKNGKISLQETRLAKLEGKTWIVNPDKFYDDFKNGVANFISDIRHDRNHLKARFRERFRAFMVGELLYIP